MKFRNQKKFRYGIAENTDPLRALSLIGKRCQSQTLGSVTWRAVCRSPRGTGAVFQVSPGPPMLHTC
jgi:hypothetical protein